MQSLFKQVNGLHKTSLPYYSHLIDHCLSLKSFTHFKILHARLVKVGLNTHTFLGNRFLDVYFRFGSLFDALRVFDEVNCKNIVSRNICLKGLCRFGEFERAQQVFDEMPERDVVSWNLMIKGCLRSGELDEAMGVFGKMKQRSIFSWNSIITGCVQGGRPKEALELFHEMQVRGGVRPDKITISSVLAACAHLGAVDHGTWVHGYLRRSGLESDVVIGTALVDMYGKCGCVEMPKEGYWHGQL